MNAETRRLLLAVILVGGTRDGRTPDLRDQHVWSPAARAASGWRSSSPAGARREGLDPRPDDGDMARLRAEQPRGSLHLADSVRPPRRRSVASAIERHGPIDVLVTCAGVVHPATSDLPDAVLERARRLLRHLVHRAALPSMLERSAAMVCISSFA
jgi:NAD(P)-dependent dehydrogenase (short-subunit alcohol dehydrogenase family)